MTTFEDLQHRHLQRKNAPEATMGEPNPEFCDPFGPLSVPYLSPSWRETLIVRGLNEFTLEEQAQAIYILVQRRLPDLTFPEFLDLSGPEDFGPWWTATRPPADEGQGEPQGKPLGRASTRRSPWRILLSAG